MAESGRGRSGKIARIEQAFGPEITSPVARTNLGLPVEVDGQVTHLNQPWEHASLPSPEPIPSERVVRELSQTDRIADPETGQRFGVIRANWDKFDPSLPVNVFFSLYGNEVNRRKKSGGSDEAHYRYEQLAHQMPDFPLLGIDFPSVGASDPLRKNQRSTDPSNSFFAIADAQLRMMASLGIKRINVGGQSMGAFAALAIAVRAAEHGIKVDNVLLYEAPGVVEMSTLDIIRRDLQEFRSLDLYHSHPYDPLLYEASGLNRSPTLMEQLALIPQQLRKDPWFVYARMMAKATVQDRIGQVFASQDKLGNGTNVSFINGTKSLISPRHNVEIIVRHFKDAGYDKRIRRTYYSGEGHWALANAKRYAADVKLHLTSSAL